MRSILVTGCTLLLFLTACSSSSDAGAPSGASPASDAAASPAIAFVDLDDASGASTTKLLWTEPVDVRITGLPASANVTLEARYVGWGAQATFQADANGNLDVATANATSGSYTGIDREGLVWSMAASTSDTDSGQDPYALRVYASVDGSVVASATLTRTIQTSDVTCTKVGDQGLVGYYCAKQGAPKVGGIVTFGGSEGGLGTGQALAEYYASLGYPSLGLAYFGTAGLPITLTSVPLEYFQTAFTWLESRPEVAPGKLAVIGGSRGGELALLLGATFPTVTAVVAVLPSGVSWGGSTFTGTTESPSWTYQGNPIPFVPYSGGQETKVTEPDGVVAYSDTAVFQQDLAAATSDQIAQASFKVENTNGPIMMIAAKDDQVWPSCDLAMLAMNRLTASGHAAAHGDTLDCYPNAGHNVTPFSLNVPTTTAMHSSVKEYGQFLALGGDPEGIAHAARDADDKTRAFLAANLE